MQQKAEHLPVGKGLNKLRKMFVVT